MKNLLQSFLGLLCCGIVGYRLLNNVIAQTTDTVKLANYSSPVDLTVFQTIRTNQFYLSDRDTLWTTRPAETYLFYTYTMINNGGVTAKHVLLYDFLPDSTTMKDEFLVYEFYNDTLCIYLYDLAPGEVLIDSFKVSVFEGAAIRIHFL